MRERHAVQHDEDEGRYKHDASQCECCRRRGDAPTSSARPEPPRSTNLTLAGRSQGTCDSGEEYEQWRIGVVEDRRMRYQRATNMEGSRARVEARDRGGQREREECETLSKLPCAAPWMSGRRMSVGEQACAASQHTESCTRHAATRMAW